MKKKEYIQPEVQVVLLSTIQQMLAGSVTSVTTTGLDDDLILPEDEEPNSGDVWEEAW